MSAVRIGAVRIDLETAYGLLEATVRHTANGRIGSPYAANGYALANARSLMFRANGEIYRTVVLGVDALTFDVRPFGWHTLYLDTDEPKADPWT